MVTTHATLEQFHNALDAELEEVLNQRQGLLYNMMLYQMGWVDQQGSPLPRPRPSRPYSILCLLSCQAAGGDYKTAMPAAAALELVRTFIEVHKDVQEGNPQQETRPSVWWVWGPGQAINVGDGLHALGRSALFRLADAGLPLKRVLNALGTLDEACIRMCEGQYLDLSYQERLDISVSSYMKMATDLTGSITAGAMALGALVATDDQQTMNAFKLSGLKLGLAYQIRKDIRALWGTGRGLSISPQILNKKKVYPIVLLLEKADLKTKRAIGNIYFKRVLEPSDVEGILSLLDESGTRKLAEDSAQRYYLEAMQILQDLGLPEDGLEELMRMAQCLVGSAEAGSDQ